MSSAFEEFEPFGADDEDENELTDEELEQTMGEWDEAVPRFNIIHLNGRLGSDPQPKYLDDGKVVLNLGLACKRKYHPLARKHYEVQWGAEETDWFNLEMWGELAEFVARTVDKGARVGVVGTLKQDRWQDRNTGEMRSRTKVVVRDFDLLETLNEAENRRARRQQRESESAGPGGFFDS